MNFSVIKHIINYGGKATPLSTPQFCDECFLIPTSSCKFLTFKFYATNKNLAVSLEEKCPECIHIIVGMIFPIQYWLDWDWAKISFHKSKTVMRCIVCIIWLYGWRLKLPSRLVQKNNLFQALSEQDTFSNNTQNFSSLNDL